MAKVRISIHPAPNTHCNRGEQRTVRTKNRAVSLLQGCPSLLPSSLLSHRAPIRSGLPEHPVIFGSAFLCCACRPFVCNVRPSAAHELYFLTGRQGLLHFLLDHFISLFSISLISLPYPCLTARVELGCTKQIKQYCNTAYFSSTYSDCLQNIGLKMLNILCELKFEIIQSLLVCTQRV